MLFLNLLPLVLSHIKLLSILEGDTMRLKRGYSLVEGIGLLVLLALIVELMLKL